MKAWGMALVMLGVATAAQAQQQFDADRLEERFEERPEIQSEPGPLVPEFSPQIAPEQAVDLTFVLNAVRVEGSTVFADEDFRPLYEEMLGTEVSVATIYDLANKITAMYGDAGYNLSFAKVPQQRIDEADGEIVIRVIEGFIENIEIQGDLRDQRGFFDYYITQLKAERPISAETLERYVYLANDLPGLSVRFVPQRSGGDTGGVTLNIIVERKRFSGSLTADNRGTDSVGVTQFVGAVSAENPLGLYDETTFQFVNASLNDELYLGSLIESFFLHPEGTKLTLNGKFIRSVPGTAALQQLDLETESVTGSLTLTHPVIRGRNMNLIGEAVLDFRNSETEIFSSDIIEDKIRSARIGFTFDNADSYLGRNQAIFELSQGLPIFGADNDAPNPSRTDGRVDYTKATLFLVREQNLSLIDNTLAPLTIKLAGFGQIARSGLLSAEECGVGGVEFGRAFDTSELTGDHCLTGSIELQFDTDTSDPFDYFRPYAFYDIGRVWNENNNPGSASLASAGFGIRIRMWDTFEGSLEMAKPLTRGVATEDNSKDPRAFFSLRGEF